jgi:exosortase
MFPMFSSARSGQSERVLRPALLAGAAALLVVLAWSFASSIAMLAGRWWNESDYLYGFLVPAFSAVLLWGRRGMLSQVAWRGSAWGLVLVGLAAALRWASACYYYELLEPLALLPGLAGIVLFAGGWRALHWAWPAIAFLVFMIPLPGFVAGALSHPLQRIGTISGTYVIQTLGIPSVDRGNVIVLSESELGVAEACNGLPMMMLFFAVCVGTALLTRRSWLEKAIIVLSAAPIAVLANVVRIAVTAILYETAGKEWGDAVFHDLAGWFMMPLAVALMWLELAILDRALVERKAASPVLPEGVAKKTNGAARGRERAETGTR